MMWCPKYHHNVLIVLWRGEYDFYTVKAEMEAIGQQMANEGSELSGEPGRPAYQDAGEIGMVSGL
jgi:hypothetical protein